MYWRRPPGSPGRRPGRTGVSWPHALEEKPPTQGLIRPSPPSPGLLGNLAISSVMAARPDGRRPGAGGRSLRGFLNLVFPVVFFVIFQKY